jgi:hypothetical protein
MEVNEASEDPCKTFIVSVAVGFVFTRYALVPVMSMFTGAVIVETADPSIFTDPFSAEHAMVV